MDLSETKGVIKNRHPWELSRTKCVLQAIRPYMSRLHKKRSKLTYINVGAGDLYFDKALLTVWHGDFAHAIDIAYEKLGKEGNITKYHRLEQSNVIADYSLMMDSLEYMEDDIEYLKRLVDKMKRPSFLFLTLPAYPLLFSDYDVKIKNLRRYSKKQIEQVIREVPHLQIVELYNFYTSLFIVRFLQKFLRLPIDPRENFTAHWPYREDSLLTRFLSNCLNFDFHLNRQLSRFGFRLPGLSMMVVCQVKK